MAISVAQARQICTQAELDLVLQSTTRQIGSLDSKQLRSAIRRARTLRDKWRDRSESQARDTKAQDPDNLDRANARSSDKAQLFDEALGRFEKRLSKVDATTNGSTKATKAKPAKATKSTRSGEHRATRSSVRSTLSEKAGEFNADGAAASSAQASAPAASPSAAAGAKNAAASGAASTKPAGKRAVAKKGATQKASAKRKGPPKRKAAPRTSSVSPPTAAAPVAPGLAAAAMAAGRDGADGSDQPAAGAKKRNPKAKTTAKATAVKPAGSPRMPGKVASQGRRSQAKRGSR